MILVGADGVSASRAAIRWSVERAASTGEEVRLVHVVDDEWGTVSHRILEEIRRDAEAIMLRERRYAESLDASVRLSTDVMEGNPMWRLVELSTAATLVAVGTHKTGFIRGRVIGSSSLLLAGASQAPVVVIPESWNKSRHGVVVGADRSPAGRVALAFAAAEAARGDRELSVVRAWSTTVPAALPQEDRQHFEEQLQADIGALLAGCEEEVRRLHPDLVIRLRRTQRGAADVLIDASGTADLLVMGSTRRQGSPTTLGSVTHDVLLNLAGPVLVVHADDILPPSTVQQDVASTTV